MALLNRFALEPASERRKERVKEECY